MSLSAIPVPTPAEADPLALFQLRCALRRRVRSLSRSLRVSQAPAQASDFDALFQDQSLTVRLSPPQRAVLGLCAKQIEADPNTSCDFGATAATALRLHSTGLARQDMDNFLRRYSPDTLPDWCFTLPAVKVPSATANGGGTLRSLGEAGRSFREAGAPASATAQGGGTLRSFSEAGRLARREQRTTSRLLRPHLPALAQLLLRKQAELAHAGRSSGFSAWLKAHNIPRQSAYRLLNKFSNPAPIKDVICTKPDAAPPARDGRAGVSGPPSPDKRQAGRVAQPRGAPRQSIDLELLPDAARFRLSPFHSVLAHRILLDARDRSPRRDLATPIVHAFLQFLSGPHLATALAWLDGSDPDFPCRRLRRHPA
ncbi:MAG: hypothetical protein ACRD1Y_14115 [Terriglobales bacterium]